MEKSDDIIPDPAYMPPVAASPAFARKDKAPYRATVRLLYRNPSSRDPVIKYGRFFAIGEVLEGVDPAHLKDMEFAGQASNKPEPEPA